MTVLHQTSQPVRFWTQNTSLVSKVIFQHQLVQSYLKQTKLTTD